MRRQNAEFLLSLNLVVQKVITGLLLSVKDCLLLSLPVRNITENEISVYLQCISNFSVQIMFLLGR